MPQVLGAARWVLSAAQCRCPESRRPL